jgi:hypothetical protein
MMCFRCNKPLNPIRFIIESPKQSTEIPEKDLEKDLLWCAMKIGFIESELDKINNLFQKVAVDLGTLSNRITELEKR